MKSWLIGFCFSFPVIAAVCTAEDARPKRIPWTTSRIHGSPDPPKPFIAQRIDPKLEFKEALEIVYEPVTKRWFALERSGKILSWPHGGQADHADLVSDIKALHPDLDNLYGLAFHPKFAENHQVFIAYTRGAGIDDGTRLSRFTMQLPSAATSTNQEPGTRNPQLDISSEQVLLTWRSGGHNGANLQFGPDGMLYISTGDSEVPSPPDPLNTGQDISDLLSSILRIDVDHADPGLAYAIPKDNPFADFTLSERSAGLQPAVSQQPAATDRGLKARAPVGNGPPKKARPEVWAYGLRNPWKMSFDRATGRLWCGDVGWELWEMIHLIERGGNYGWSAMEAGQPVRADAPKPPTPIRPPVVAHSHDKAASITGGYVYHGRKFPELKGAYIYGDYVTGKIWALWHDGTRVTRHEEIADTDHKIIAFGMTESGRGFQPLPLEGKGKMPVPLSSADDDGICYLDYSEKGALYELVRNRTKKTEKFPTKLSETGLFVGDVRDQTPAPGVYGFNINSPMWLDWAYSRYWIALPGVDGIRTNVKSWEDKNNSPKADYKSAWPQGAVLVKTIMMDFDRARARRIQQGADPFGEGKSKETHHLIESQILHYNGQSWDGYSYRWNDDGTEASLVMGTGDERSLVVRDDADSSGSRHYKWRFPSRAECIRCHNSWCDYALAFQPSQINTDLDGAYLREHRLFHNQLDELVHLGIVGPRYAEQSNLRLTSWFDDEARRMDLSLNDRARSYLHANCSHCHRQNAGGAVTMMLNAELLLGQTRTVGVTPQQGGLGLAKPKLIDPGNPWNSVIALRLAKTGTGHMPVIGPHEVDVEGLKLIEDWIARMGNQAASATDLLPKEWSEPLLKEKLATVDGAMQVLRAVDDGLIKETLRQKALDLAWSSPLPTVRDLFDRFLPDDKRVATIGPNPDANQILALQGDAMRGAQLLSPQGKLAACFACHLINGAGRDFGPDLSKVATRLKPGQMLESLLQPSKTIAQGYQAVSVEATDGAVQAGFIVKDSAGDLSLKTAIGQTVTVQKSNIAKQTNLPVSLMPEGLAQGLTAQEAADLLGFLNSLK